MVLTINDLCKFWNRQEIKRSGNKKLSWQPTYLCPDRAWNIHTQSGGNYLVGTANAERDKEEGVELCLKFPAINRATWQKLFTVCLTVEIIFLVSCKMFSKERIMGQRE